MAAVTWATSTSLERAATADYINSVHRQVDAIDNAIARLATSFTALYVRIQDTVPSNPCALRHIFQSFLLPFGTFAAGVWQPGDDVNVLLLSPPTLRGWYKQIIQESLGAGSITKDDNSSGASDLRIAWSHLIPKSALRPQSGEFILTIALLPTAFDLGPSVIDGNLSYSENDACSRAEARTLACVQHVWQLNLRLRQKGLEEPTLKLEHAKVHRWAKAMGLIAPELDLCTSYRLYELFVGAAEGCLQYASDNAEDVDPRFFRAFCTRGDVPIAVLVGERPGEQAEGWSAPAIRALADAFKVTRENHLTDPYFDDTIFTKEFGASMFLNHAGFIGATFEFWDMNAIDVARWRSIVPEMLRKGIEVLVPSSLHPRIWPYPCLTSTSITYFVGVTQPMDFTKVEVSRTLQKPKWRLEYSLPSREEVAADLGIDPSRKGALTTMRREQKMMSEGINAASETQMRSLSSGDDRGATSEDLTAETVGRRPQQSTQDLETTAPAEEELARPATKLRTAQSAISRLRTDPMHRSVLYKVGYRDRFLEDLQWLPLEQWGKATEDEDFIPLSRVYQLRRCDNEGVVWDRTAKIDKTGVQPEMLSLNG